MNKQNNMHILEDNFSLTFTLNVIIIVKFKKLSQLRKIVSVEVAWEAAKTVEFKGLCCVVIVDFICDDVLSSLDGFL